MMTAMTSLVVTIIPSFLIALMAFCGSSTMRLMTPKVAVVAIVVARMFTFALPRIPVSLASCPGLFSAKTEI